jgi:hypothetical protein
MMKYMMKFDANIPVTTSMRARLNSPLVAPIRCARLRPSALFLDFLRRLPEKQIRRNSRAKNANQDRQEIAGPGRSRDNRREQRSPPVDMRKKSRRDVGEQYKGRPFEDARNLSIRRPKQKADDQRGKHRGPELGGCAAHHCRRFAHAREIGGDIDDICCN